MDQAAGCSLLREGSWSPRPTAKTSIEMCVCPADGSLFHRWQHVRSFCADSLTALLADHGFAPIVVHRLELSDRIFGEHGADLARDPFWAHLFETERPISVGTGDKLIWIGGCHVAFLTSSRNESKQGQTPGSQGVTLL